MLRGILAIIAIPLAPVLHRDHVAGLVSLRPTKDVFLFAGFQVNRGHTTLPAVVAAALPLLLGGVWASFGLGRAYADRLDEGELPGLLGRVLPAKRIDAMRSLLDEKGSRVLFLGRLAAFPSTVMAAAAGASGMSWRRFVVSDGAGALLSLAVALELGDVLEDAYESGGTWLSVLGVVVLAMGAVVLGRSLKHHSLEHHGQGRAARRPAAPEDAS